MSNYEMYKQLNEKTRALITRTLSWIDFLSNNEFSFSMRSDNPEEKFYNKLTDQVDIVTSSVFLAALSENGEIKRIFNNHGISVNDFTKFCKNPTTPLDIKEDASLTEAFDEVDLDSIFKNIVESIQYNNDMGDKKFDIADVEPRHVFDYFTQTYYEVLEDLKESETVDTEEDDERFADAMEEYNQFYEQSEKELMAKYGIDLNIAHEDDENVEYTYGDITLIYDNGEVVINLEPGVVEKEVPIISGDGENKSIKLLTGTHVYKISNKKANKAALDEFASDFKNSAFCNFTVWDANRAGTFTFTAYKEDMFYNGIDEEQAKEQINKNTETAKEQGGKYSLSTLGTDLTKKKFIKNPAIGRDKELDQLEITLLFKEKDMSICITGDAGVGKTALVEGLCYRIQNGTVSDSLKDVRIIKLDISSLVAGTQYVGTLEKKMESILKEASEDKNIILFIDELHRAMGAGKTEGNNNTVAEMLKQYLDRGDVRIIGATTTDEYTEFIEPNTAFKTRFDVVELKEPEDKVIHLILDDLITSYNKLGSPVIDMDDEKRSALIDSLISATRRTFRDYKDRANNPRLIVNIIKKAYAIADFQKSKVVTIDHILQAYNSCERLYKDSRDRQSKIIKGAYDKEEPKKQTGVILEFKPREKKQ